MSVQTGQIAQMASATMEMVITTANAREDSNSRTAPARVSFNSSYSDFLYDISYMYNCVCIQMVGNDRKKLQVVYFYVNKPVVVGTCPYKGKQK